jgi:adenine-specific DNA methylase
MTDQPRLIEVAFPLKQASLDSVHEKNVRHGHISTLHIWPARRPLAACRAALIATLLPDPGNDEERQRLLEMIGGKVVRAVEKKQQGNRTVEVVKEETEGGILHWGREGGPDMDWFREEIKKAYGGRAPRVLDPFAGGGAIPLEAMRLGCEATAVDINPVAWFILKCTLEYPQKLAGQVRPLPKFALESREFMEGFFKGTGVTGKRQLRQNLEAVQQNLFPPPDVDLAWHVRAWGWWVLQRARIDLARFYPVVDNKPTVAYLWARNVACKNCRARIPLLKTLWLCKKDSNRVLLTMRANDDKMGVIFGVQPDVPVSGGNAAQRKENDRRLATGTMSRSGVTCPCCGIITKTDDIQQEAQAERLGQELVAVVVSTKDGYGFRPVTASDTDAWMECKTALEQLLRSDTIGRLSEPIDPRRPSPNARGLSGLTRYGITTFEKVFNTRQKAALYTLASLFRSLPSYLGQEGYDEKWATVITDLLTLSIGRVADYNSEFCTWNINRQTLRDTFARFALPMTTDYSESNPIGGMTGGFAGAVEWIALCIEHLQQTAAGHGEVLLGSAEDQGDATCDLVLTDPPYYDSIPYSDISDFFYVWIRRAAGDRHPSVFCVPLVNRERELIQHAGRMGGDNDAARTFYEDGMARSFAAAWQRLKPDGRMVVVFAHKKPDAWETLVSAMIRVGFVVTASWPIQTERPTRTAGGARLASSVWLVCKKRPAAARPGWDNRVLDEMRANIHKRLNDYWKAGIRGPDFVWAATGPALEAFSKHPVVKKATAPGETMSVSEFLRAVRRLVVDFVVGRVLTGNGDGSRVEGMDDVTTYYLLHRHDFGVSDAPVGACILYAVSCSLSDSALVDRHDLLLRTGGKAADDDDEQEEDDEEKEAEGGGSGSRVKLKPWSQRKRKTMGFDAEGRPAPMIDQVHRLMHLWKAGDVVKVDEYLNDRGLRRNALFQQLLQALIELSERGGEERSLLECVSNHISARGVDKPEQPDLFDGQLFSETEEGTAR